MGRRADKGNAGFGDRFCKIGVFGQKTVTRMYRVRTGHFGGGDDGVNIQIAHGRRRRADAHGFIGHAHMQTAAVRFRIDGYGLNAHFLERANDA